MPVPTPSPGDAPADGAPSPEVLAIESALNRITYLTARARQHTRLMSQAGVPLDRAGAALLRQVAEAEPLRPSELALRMSVEASHVTRQAQQLQRAGYLTRVADPEDRRAQRIRITGAGREAVRKIRDASGRSMEVALADWSPEELTQLATLFNKMVDDFLAHADNFSEEESTDGTSPHGH
ncbi:MULTISPECIES: MarR family winged helix-turn-helix transcriptional regulator [unclassified Streptomyces]|uniref:MarR family winged helix-turn-helix transcriptional regulator n=1 Tax=unclassified Streptomyces TaxID=2593676 RepID=UPI001905B1B8|nr:MULTISPECIES: MarR family transcriptional regulator [unclassified Streptomyces]MCU4745229.1 MarR family transcriptional regulator [Streptomyces sp. G-5]QQN79828.1 MarR family transcriptional regulator [Streptomyces sp. XC 2026]